MDPMSGTGSIPVEASLVGARVVALDKSREMTLGSLSNMHHFAQEWEGVIVADALRPPLKVVDAVATDLPYGRVSSTGRLGASGVSKGFLAVLPSILKPGSRAVLMHPQAVPVTPGKELELEEEHHLYVHKLLTRTITILRRS